jgi:thioredoxin-like negative regulator of GroEL|tara:strand:- start:200 stop:532 length:333 start_codon:yes stop_codon:yes gene_type:complete
MPGERVVISNRTEFKNYVKKNKFVIVKIGATWCGPCKRCSPTVEKFFNQMPEKVNMVDVDADSCCDVKNYLKIKAVPTLIAFINGDPCEIYQTSNDNEIKNFFEKVLKYC